MKVKISLRTEEKILRIAKRQAAKEGRSLSELIQEAIEQYLREGAVSRKERERAFQFFCERPMKIPQEELRYLLDEDMWAI